MNGIRVEQPRGRWALTNGRVILPREIITGQALVGEDGLIIGVVDAGSVGADVERIDVGDRYIAPGLIDIHIHGALGHTFNEPTEQAFASITAANAARGVTSLLATVATAPLSDMVRCLEFARAWMSESHGGAQVLGVHLEGPYFSLSEKGAQDPASIRTPDDGTPEILLKHHDVLKIFTYAPELPGAPELTTRLTKLAITPAAGHSSARDKDIYAAIELGLSHAVHLWSGQSSTVREGPWRRPGLLETALVSDELTAEMITDNRHLPSTLMKLAYACKGADRLCAVSDATSGAGLPESTRFHMGDLEYEVHDGVGMLLDRTAFAGSTTLLNQMVPILTNVVGVPLVEAIRMVSLTPARIIGVDDHKGSLEPGKDADISIFMHNFSAWRTMIAGQWAFVA